MAQPTLSRDHLKLGIFAWRLGYIDQAQLAAAVRHCLDDDSESLGHALVQLGFVTEDSVTQLEQLLADQLKHHAGSAEASWSSLACDPSTISFLGDTDDPDLARFTTDRLADDTKDDVLQLHGQLRVLGLHAEGGLGRVHRATDEVLGREVALKEVRPEMADRPEARRRFVREAQITGRLEHPGIVPVYGLGTGRDGRPYYAMRMVEGETLTDRIKRFHGSNGNGTRDFDSVEFRGLVDRLTDVAQAIRYAHSRGVLHRDLKPDNILLGEYGETLVIDWGLARQPLAEQDGTGSPLGEGDANQAEPSDAGSDPTQHGHVFGTVGYAPPEQLNGQVELITERSDVYALGAILYQMLVGRPPITSPGNGRDVRELVELTLAGRITAPRQVDSAIPKPLSAICMRALATQPDDRYPSVEALLEELVHWKADQPVEAAPDSALDRVARLSRRYRTAALAAAAALLAITLVATGALLLVNRARLSESDARQKAQQLADEKTQLASEKTRLADRNQNVLEAFVEAFDSASPDHEGVTSDMTAREVLDRALERIESDPELATDELSKGTLLFALGSSFNALGEVDQAITALEDSLRLRKTKLGREDPETLDSMNGLAAAYHAAGRVDETVQLYEETLRLRAKVLGAEDPETLTTMGNLAFAYDSAGRYDESVALERKTLALRRRVLGEDHPRTLLSMGNLAASLKSAGRFEESLAINEELLGLRKIHVGLDHPETLTCMNNLAEGYRSTGRLKEAVPLFETTLRLRQAKLGEDHPETLITMNNLAFAYKLAGRLDDALAMYEESYRLANAKLGPEHPFTLITTNNLASGYWAAGRLNKALPMFEESLRLRKAIQGPKHPDTLVGMNNLAFVLQRAGRLDEALAMSQETFRLRKEVLGPDHPHTLITMNNLAVALEAAGRRDEALPLYEESVQLMKAKLGPEHSNTLQAVSNLAVAYEGVGRLADAVPLLEQVLQLRKETLGDDHPDTLAGMHSLAGSYCVADRLREAIALYQAALPLRKTKLGEDHPETLKTMYFLAAALAQDRRYEEAVEIIAELTSQLDPQDTNVRLARAMTLQAMCLLELGQVADAHTALETVLNMEQIDELERLQATTIQAAVKVEPLDFEAAAPLLVAAYEELYSRMGDLKPIERWQVSRACERVLEMFRTAEQAEELKAWEDRLADVNAQIERMRNENVAKESDA